WQLAGDRLAWTSAIKTPAAENNLARARLFTPRRERKNKPRAAVVVLPQWNAQPDSHVEACRIFNGLGMTALRLTLPYHEERRPPEIERADHLVGSNIGRTIQSMRQAVLDTRAAVRWLKDQGTERIGIYLDMVCLLCGHYEMNELAWKAFCVAKIATIFRKHL